VERRLAYEESIRMPLVMRYPKEIRAGMRIDEMALGIDMAPTMFELAGVPIPNDIEGASHLPLWRRQFEDWREHFLIEYYSDTVFPRMDHLGYQAVRTTQWKYIRYRELEGMDELYDLEADPYEMRNLIDAPEAQDVLARLQSELNAFAPDKTA
jgi:N-acetylglucosamine-6-sulfatase